jgi:hypothetical protein
LGQERQRGLSLERRIVTRDNIASLVSIGFRN